MSNSILSSLFARSAFRATNNRTGYQCWTNLKVVAVEIDSSSANADVPLASSEGNETGTYAQLMEADIQTAKIIRPTRMRVTAISPDVSTTNSVLAVYADVEATLTITTKSVIADLMAVTHVTIQQDDEAINVARLTIELEQCAQPDYDPYNPVNQADETAIGTRVQRPPTIAQTVSGLYNKVANFIGGF